jgi:cell division protein FtsB
MPSLSDLRSVGVSLPLAALVLGASGGWLVCDTLKGEQIQSLQGELSLALKQAEDARQQSAQQCPADIKATVAQCEHSRVLLGQQTQKLEQLSAWNAQWSENYKALETNCNALAASHNLAKELAEVRAQWDQSTGDVIRYTSGNCGQQANDCDLIPLAQRKLKALETRRDQLQGQVLDLQGRVSCVPKQ